MDSEKGKVFIGGISFQTTEERLKGYFTTFGEVVEAVIMKDRFTRRSWGFGFLVFADPAVADRLLLFSKHNIDGRMVIRCSLTLFFYFLLTGLKIYKLQVMISSCFYLFHKISRWKLKKQFPEINNKAQVGVGIIQLLMAP